MKITPTKFNVIENCTCRYGSKPINSILFIGIAKTKTVSLVSIRWIWMGILLAGMLSACENVSHLEKGSLVAHGELLDGAQEPLYYSIWVDFNKPVDARIMGFLVKFAQNAPPISLAKLHPELVTQYLLPFTPPPHWPESWKQKAKEEIAYTGGGFHIKFKNGRLLFVGICSHCAGNREYPIVGTPDGQKFYEVPLTEKQVTEVFFSPNRIYKVHEVRGIDANV